MRKIVASIEEKLKKVDKYSLILCLVSMIAGILYLSVTMGAKPAGDDCMSLPTDYYNISHTTWLQSVKQHIMKILSYFKLEHARFFPFFFPAGFIRSWFKVSIGVYRLYIIVYTYLDILVLSYFLSRVLKNKNVGRTVFCIMPLLIGLWSQIDTNAMYCYEGLVQATLFPMLLSGLCLIRWSDTKKKRYIILAALLSFYSCATYELGFILIIPVWGLIWIYENNLKKSILRIIPAVSGEIVTLIINFLCRYTHRMESTQGVAYGVQFSFDINAILKTFSYQLKAGIPILGMWTNHVGFGEVVFSDIYLSIILALIVVVMVKQLKTISAKNNLLLFLVGLSLFSGPAGLISLSVKFQEYEWVNENYGYLPAVIQQFGFGVMLVSILVAIIKFIDNRNLIKLKEIMLIVLLIVLIPLGIYQRSAARERNMTGDIEYSWCIQSIKNGFLDRGNDNAQYISFRNVWGDSDVAQEIFVKRYANKDMNITSIENWKSSNTVQNGLYMYGVHMNEFNNIPVAWIGEAVDSSANAMKNVTLYIPNNIEEDSLLQYEYLDVNNVKHMLSVELRSFHMEYDEVGIYVYLNEVNIIPDIFRIIEE